MNKKVEKYQIDHRLRPGKDYPVELIPLLKAFRTRSMGFTPPNTRKKIGAYQRQISLAERTFKEYFLHIVEGIIKIRKSLPGKIEVIEDPEKIAKLALKIKTIDPLHVNCIRRVNARLKYFTPQLIGDGEAGYKLEPFTLESKKDLFGEAILWAWLAKVLNSRTGLDPGLVHECLYCQKIFISRQRKKFHPECQKKYFSEKYILEGIAKERQKAYRVRKKENA